MLQLSEGLSTLPPQLQEQIMRLQQLQRTLQVVVTQKTQLELELTEINAALNELEKMKKGAVIYKSVGSLLLKTDKKSISTELKERKDLVNTRITILTKQEERSRKKVEELQKKIQAKLKTTGV